MKDSIIMEITAAESVCVSAAMVLYIQHLQTIPDGPMKDQLFVLVEGFLDKFARLVNEAAREEAAR